MIPDAQILLRLIIAAGLGAVVGFERERQNQVAGLRTHIIVSVGSSLAMATLSDIHRRHLSQPNRQRGSRPTGCPGRFRDRLSRRRRHSTLRHQCEGADHGSLPMDNGCDRAGSGCWHVAPCSRDHLAAAVRLDARQRAGERLIREVTTWTVTFQAVDHPELYEQFRQTGIPAGSESEIDGLQQGPRGKPGDDRSYDRDD